MLKTSVGVHPSLVIAAKTTQSKVSTVTHCLVCLNYSTMQLPLPVVHQILGKVCVVFISLNLPASIFLYIFSKNSYSLMGSPLAK